MMKLSAIANGLRAGAPCLLALLAIPLGTTAFGQTVKPPVWLEPAQTIPAASEPLAKGEASFANAPANFRSFPSVHVGESAPAQQLTLHFEAPARLTKIESSKEFPVKAGGSCFEGDAYAAGGSCTLLVGFAPQGAGPRLGHLTISHTASPEPMSLGLGGNGYAPVLSFTPAVVTTVPGTFPSNKGLLSGAQNLAVDGGDSLYIADTGNGTIWYLDSSGAIKSLATGYSSPRGIAVDTFGEVYFDESAANVMYEIYDYGPVVQANGTGTGSCPAATPCTLSSHAITNPGTMSMDPYNHLFFVEGTSGAAFSTVQPVPPNLVFLYDPFPYQTTTSSPIVVDSGDNIYSLWSLSSVCEIVVSTLYNAENSNVAFNKVAGGHTCGFSGDGGEAGNAEIGATVGQMAFDLAGNFYFSDTANQRVRRIDAVTGIINTIAGNGAAGYSGDAGPANLAQLSSPSGVAVDSQGQVYIISAAAATGTAQVVRKLGPNGIAYFGGQLRGIPSAAKLVTVSNTGNSAMVLTNAVITGANASDFSIDPTTTSCLLTPGSSLNSGQSCKVGIIFKPGAAGARGANLELLNNTVTNSNTVQLSGIGTLPIPTMTITSPVPGTSVASGTAVKFAVTVTSASGPAPTGTVKFTVDGSAIGSPVTLSSGAASVSVTETVAGTHTLAATYSGDSNYSAAGPVSRTYTVTAAAVKRGASTVKLAPAANPGTACKTIRFTISVAGKEGAKPTGEVSLIEGTARLGWGRLTNGNASLAIKSLTQGTHHLQAVYSGDTRYLSSTSGMIKEIVKASQSCNVVSAGPVTGTEPTRQ